MEILIGTDPEMFIYDGTVNHIISGDKLVPGTKHSPFFVNDGAVQLDGVAAEFNIFPARNGEEFVQKIRSVQNTLLVIIREMAESLGHPDPSLLSLVAQPTAYFSKAYFDALPDEVKALGCQPDVNAWTGAIQKPSGRTSDDHPFRTGGFHIHVGWTKNESSNTNSPHFRKTLDMAKQLDLAIFMPSLLWDDDDKRRELYGARGSFRPKNYGMEYRSLSNAALNSDDLLIWLFDTSVHAANLLFEGRNLFDNEVLLPDVGIVHDPLEYHYILHEDYGFPLLPKNYTEITKAA